MKSNLEIDYGKPHSKEFEKASTSPSFSTSYAMDNQQKDSGHIIVDLFADSDDSNEKKRHNKKRNMSSHILKREPGIDSFPRIVTFYFLIRKK